MSCHNNIRIVYVMMLVIGLLIGQSRRVKIEIQMFVLLHWPHLAVHRLSGHHWKWRAFVNTTT